jgi:general secretion pathway protein G
MRIQLRPALQRLKRVAATPFAGERDRGMSLIEIIIVVALLGSLMAYMASNLIGKSEETKKDEAKLAMGVLEQSLQAYAIHNHRMPTTEQGLSALLTAPADAKSWRGPYTEPNKLKDPWDVAFGYESDGRKYKITSAGPDGQMGTGDDISYPDTGDGGAPATTP